MQQPNLNAYYSLVYKGHLLAKFLTGSCVVNELTTHCRLWLVSVFKHTKFKRLYGIQARRGPLWILGQLVLRTGMVLKVLKYQYTISNENAMWGCIVKIFKIFLLVLWFVQNPKLVFNYFKSYKNRPSTKKKETKNLYILHMERIINNLM